MIKGIVLFVPRVVCVASCLVIVGLAYPVLWWLDDKRLPDP